MSSVFHQRLQARLDAKDRDGTRKSMRPIAGPIGPRVQSADGQKRLFASNDYLSFCNDPRIREASIRAIERFGAGTGAARFISGTLDSHVALERALAGFFGKAAALTFVSGWAANTAIMPALAEGDDVIFADRLNHASLIDGCRLAGKTAKVVVYEHRDMARLEDALRATPCRGTRFIVTDGVFSMEGTIAPLGKIAALAKTYQAITVVDDAHGVGVVGATGRGAAERAGCLEHIDILTGSLGKALGGAPGGFIAAEQPVIDVLVEEARPQLFSNSQCPAAVAATLEAVTLVAGDPALVSRLQEKVAFFKSLCAARQIPTLPSDSAIVAVPIGEAQRAKDIAKALYADDIFVTAFSYPVVPKGAARLRFQINRGHTDDDMTYAADRLAHWLRAMS